MPEVRNIKTKQKTKHKNPGRRMIKGHRSQIKKCLVVKCLRINNQVSK